MVIMGGKAINPQIPVWIRINLSVSFRLFFIPLEVADPDNLSGFKIKEILNARHETEIFKSEDQFLNFNRGFFLGCPGHLCFRFWYRYTQRLCSVSVEENWWVPSFRETKYR